MRILITGATGNVGKAAVALLTRQGHTVRVIGRRKGLSVEGAEYRSCDITDYPSLLDAARESDAVVHLAAFSDPSVATPEALFRANCGGTFNVYQAAVEAGARRVVNASSINSLGLGFGVKASRIGYVPVDEDHPTWTTDAYSFSKNIVEEIGAYFERREGITGVSMRIPAVNAAKYNARDVVVPTIDECRREFERLHSLSNDERSSTINGWMQKIAETREGRFMENRPPGWRGIFPGNALMGPWNDLWTVVDERDSAAAISLAVTGSYEGHHILFVNDRVNRVGIPSADLIQTLYPQVQVNHPLQGYESLVSIDKARSILGYEPEFSLERYFG